MHDDFGERMVLFCLFISSEDHPYDGGVGVNPRVPTHVSAPPHQS